VGTNRYLPYFVGISVEARKTSETLAKWEPENEEWSPFATPTRE